MSAWDNLEDRSIRWGEGDPAELDARELPTEIDGELHLGEPGDYIVIHADGSGEMRRRQL
jgi:hypothetical protein